MAAMAVLVINLETESSERIDYNGLSGFDLSYKLFSDYEKGAPVVITAPSESFLYNAFHLSDIREDKL